MGDHHGHLARQIADIAIQMRDYDDRMSNVERELHANTEITTEVRDLFTAVKSGFKVLGWLGVAAKWVAGLVGVAASLYAAWHTFTSGGAGPK